MGSGSSSRNSFILLCFLLISEKEQNIAEWMDLPRCTPPHTMGHLPSAPQSNEKAGAHGVVAGLAHRVAAEDPRAVRLSRATLRCVGPSPRAKRCLRAESSSGLCWRKRMLEEDTFYPA